MLKIIVPKPCHESWQQMQPTQRGAFCNSCSKEVVDFTLMTDEEVKNYFLHKVNSSTCGRFRDDQLSKVAVDIPLSLLKKRMAGWKKFLAILMISFGAMLFGCEVKTSKVVVNTAQHTKGEPSIDTVEIYESIFAGVPAFIEDSTIEKISTNYCETTSLMPPLIIGDVAVVDTVISILDPDSSLIKKDKTIPNKKDSAVIKQKIPADSSTCGDDIIYSK